MSKALTEEDVRLNEQAVDVATSVVHATVEAAARCEQATQDMQLEAVGVGAVNRGFVKGAKALSRVMMPRTMSGINQMETGGLPRSFILAATADKVYAIEDKHDNGTLQPGKVLKEWDRSSFTAKLSDVAALTMVSGVPDDRHLLIIYLPMTGSRSKYMDRAAAISDAAGSPGMPTKIMLAKDDASQKLIDAVTANAPAPGANIMIGGQSLADMMGQAQMGQAAAQADPTEQLSKLADLRDRGVLSDEEFEAQKQKILAGS